MDTLHAVICILAGAVVSLVLSPMMLKPLDSHNRTAMNIAVCVVSAAILVAGGILIWIVWGVSAVAYLVGVLLCGGMMVMLFPHSLFDSEFFKQHLVDAFARKGDDVAARIGL